MAALVLPGTLFHPSEQDLVGYYLTNKNLNPGAVGAEHAFTFIREFNLYDYSPYDLPANTCYSYGENGSKRHWYCYTAARTLNENELMRRARGGFWRGAGYVKSVMNYAGDTVIGTRRTFLLYVGNVGASAVVTDWVLHEYSLPAHQMPSFVVCRLFIKPDDNLAESSGSQSSVVYNFISPYSFSGLLVVGNGQINNGRGQLIGNIAPDVIESSSVSENLTSEKEDEEQVDSLGGNQEPNNHPISPHHPQTSHNQLSPQPAADDATQIELWTNEQLKAAIDKGDFIELDDLAD